jgi:hypothetical protein
MYFILSLSVQPGLNRHLEVRSFLSYPLNDRRKHNVLSKAENIGIEPMLPVIVDYCLANSYLASRSILQLS